MNEYEAQIVLEHNEDKIEITVSSRTAEGWPEHLIERLLDVLKEQLEGFVVTEKKVK